MDNLKQLIKSLSQFQLSVQYFPSIELRLIALVVHQTQLSVASLHVAIIVFYSFFAWHCLREDVVCYLIVQSAQFATLVRP